jgi:hypothetical protein
VPLALWDWAAFHAARDSTRFLRCRILRIEALCALGRVRDAYNLTASLMYGEHLPCPHSSRTMWFRDESGVPLAPPKPLPEFCEAALPGDAKNKNAIALLTNGGIHPVIEAFYGAWVCAHIALARARILLLLGGVPYLWTGPQPTRVGAVKAEKAQLNTASAPEKVRRSLDSVSAF